ncbi:MAG: DUF3365 domain-containing protein [Rhodospirillaceae bacterium]|nr:DUF3365 domain-containing protein [Rhodospirillaceae bacterium]
MGLKAKFNLIMVAAFAVGFALSTVLAYRILQESARGEILQQARLMMEAARAIRGYTVDETAPLLEDHMSVRFLPNAVPAFAAQATLRRLGTAYRSYAYKEAALNPTNPADRATDWEAAIIKAFQANPKLGESVVERETPDGQTLSLARPLRIEDGACLACHATPAAAPATMVDLYGVHNGFGWKLGDVIGAQIVSVPENVALAKANRAFIFVLGALGAVFLVMMLVLNLLLHLLIAKRVRRISDIASEVSLGNLSAPEFDQRGKDEIASLAASFNRMRRSLVDAMKMLETS